MKVGDKPHGPEGAPAATVPLPEREEGTSPARSRNLPAGGAAFMTPFNPLSFPFSGEGSQCFKRHRNEERKRPPRTHSAPVPVKCEGAGKPAPGLKGRGNETHVHPVDTGPVQSHEQ